MTPKLKLSDEARKALLSWMRKWRLLGMRRMGMSMRMTDAPAMHARPLKPHMIQPRVSLSMALVSMARALDAGFLEFEGFGA